MSRLARLCAHPSCTTTIIHTPLAYCPTHAIELARELRAQSKARLDAATTDVTRAAS